MRGVWVGWAGDALLDYCVLIRCFFSEGDGVEDKWDPGALHLAKISTVNNDALGAKAAQWLVAHKHVRVDSLALMAQIEAHLKGDAGPPKVLADVMESLIAAVFVDTGGDLPLVYRTFMPHLMPDDVAIAPPPATETMDTTDASEAALPTPPLTHAQVVRLLQGLPSLAGLAGRWGVVTEGAGVASGEKRRKTDVRQVAVPVPPELAEG
jgi:hypothetical protein